MSVQMSSGSSPDLGRPRRAVGGIIALAVLLPLVLTFTFLLPLVIWPGQIKLLAPFFCDDAQPDAFVVSDTYNPRPGETTTNFTLYCMGPNGDATDVGYFGPFLATMALNVGIILVLVIVFMLLRKLFRRGGGSAPEPFPEPEIDPRLMGPGSTAGPFVQ